MTNPQHQYESAAAAFASTTGILVVATAATGVLGLGMLAAGSALRHMPLLAWGVVAATLAIALGCMAAIRSMLHSAVNGSVRRTAVTVGGAIADALSEDRETSGVPDPDAGSVTDIYS